MEWLWQASMHYNGETCIQRFSTERKHYWLHQCISNQTDESTKYKAWYFPTRLFLYTKALLLATVHPFIWKRNILGFWWCNIVNHCIKQYIISLLHIKMISKEGLRHFQAIVRESWNSKSLNSKRICLFVKQIPCPFLIFRSARFRDLILRKVQRSFEIDEFPLKTTISPQKW